MAYSVFLPEIPPNMRSMPPRVPHPCYRHASPSGPWPWSDLEDISWDFGSTSSVECDSDSTIQDDEVEEEQTKNKDKTRMQHRTLSKVKWTGYPWVLFPNWRRSQIVRSGIARVIGGDIAFLKTFSVPPCKIHYIDVLKDGSFSDQARHVITDENPDELWSAMQKARPGNVRIRGMFVENLSGPVLQMLGTKYNIEPFFFSSSLNWIPSRYQEDILKDYGDHITITLNFLRTMANPMLAPPTSPVSGYAGKTISHAGTATIDTQAPLALRSNDRIVLIDLLAIHMIRRPDSSTIISYHPPPEWRSTSATYLHSRVRFAGQSVYWKNIMQCSDDPTFVLLCILWYALYAWNESFECLYQHICWLESRVLVTNDIHLTRELHIIRASLLHYASLLEDFKKTVVFVRNTPNPAIQTHVNVDQSMELMQKECDTLLSELERLEMSRKMQDMRLDNVMNLAFSSVNFEDSRDMQKLTEASLRDGAAMKQISYLTMVFLPASFVATVFGMNIKELSVDTQGSLSHYIAASIPLTAVTIWIILALHSKACRGDPEVGFWGSLRWPLMVVDKFFRKRTEKHNSMV